MPFSQANNHFISTPKTHDITIEDWFYAGPYINHIPYSELSEYIDRPRTASVSFPINYSMQTQPMRKRASMPYVSPYDQYIQPSNLDHTQPNLVTIPDVSLYLQQTDLHKTNSFCPTPEFSSSGSASPDPSTQFEALFDSLLIPLEFAEDQNSRSNSIIRDTSSTNAFSKPEINQSPPKQYDLIPNKIKFIHCNPSKRIHPSTSKALRYYPTISCAEVDSFDSQPTGKENKGHLCPYCSRHFRRRHDLHRHIRLHTGERPYSCDLCTKAFYRTDALKRHYRSEHKIMLPSKS